MKSFTFGRIVGNRGAFLRSAGRIPWILMASRSIWAVRVDPRAPRLALAPALAFAQHFDESDFDDDARGSPGERLLANKLCVRCTLASRLRVEGDEPVETVEEIRHVHRGPPKRQRPFLRVSQIGVTAWRRWDCRLAMSRACA